MALSKLTSAGMLALLATQALADPASCPSQSPLSCSSSSIEPSCCFNSPGGSLLLTQFWDYDPSTGPHNSWTIHGLWPDNCDGSYEAYCDKSREYTNITAIIKDHNRNDLLAHMNKYWKDYNGEDEQFWAHEWNKHGTCINTIEPSCYSDYTAQEEVVDYLAKTVELDKDLDTYKALAKAGIRPSKTKTYTRSEIESALASIHNGFIPRLGCKDGNLNEVWYFFYVRGNLITGQYEPSEPLSSSSCPAEGIKYIPKTTGRVPPPSACKGSAN